MLVLYLTALVTLAGLLKHLYQKYRCYHQDRSSLQYHHHFQQDSKLKKAAAEAAAAKHAPQYPHLDPLFGLDLAVQTWRDFQRGELSEGMRQRHVLYGATFSAKSLSLFGGVSEAIYTIDPANISAVTTHNFDQFGKSAWVDEAAKHVGHGVLLNEGEAWKHSRAMLKPIFNRSALDEPTLLEPHVRRLVNTMRSLSEGSSQSPHSCRPPEGSNREEEEKRKGKSHVLDFHELASMFTLDVVTEFLFGKSTLCLQSPRQEDGRDGVRFLSLVKDFEGPSGKFIAVGPLAWLGLAPSYRRLISLVDGMKAFFRKKLNDIIEETGPCGNGVSGSIGGGQVFSSPHSQSHSKWQSPSVFRSMKAAGASDDQIQGELQNIFFASYDTTSAFLANVMYVLVHNPGVQLRLRQEIGVLGGRSPTNQDLAKLEYLRMFLKEALRLYSPVSSHSRTAKVDTVLPRGGGGDGLSPLVVRAGATVIWSTYSLNRDPRRYGPDWAAFRPERWAAGGSASGRGTGGRLKFYQQQPQNNGTNANQETAVGVTDLPPSDPAACKGRNAFVGRVGDTTGAARDNLDNVGPKWRDSFMPFGSGPRSCLGQQMVQSEVAYVIVRLLQEFQEIRVGGVDDDARQYHGTEARQPTFREAKAVSFYNAEGVLISVE